MAGPVAPVSVFRLRFIDMARAVAILCMLEGHFVELTLAPQWKLAGHPVYEAWLYVRGLAAPMFFTVTGVVFAYLLYGGAGDGFFASRRVRRGLVRAGELMFWGYLLQVDLRMLPGVIQGRRDVWLENFHVLQCIAVGLLGMIGMFGMVRRGGARVLAACYGALGLLLFLVSIGLANREGVFPPAAPAWFQNAIKGPSSSFPVAPWLGYTFYGAAIGVLVRRHTQADRAMSATPFLVAGAILSVFGWPLDRQLGRWLLDLMGHGTDPRVLPDAFHGRIGEILLVLGALVWCEKRFRAGLPWLQTVGRNTFPIYVAHVIVLYGGIFGIGVENWLEGRLGPWQAALGAVLCCGIFGCCAQWVEPLMLRFKLRRAACASG